MRRIAFVAYLSEYMTGEKDCEYWRARGERVCWARRIVRSSSRRFILFSIPSASPGVVPGGALQTVPVRVRRREQGWGCSPPPAPAPIRAIDLLSHATSPFGGDPDKRNDMSKVGCGCGECREQRKLAAAVTRASLASASKKLGECYMCSGK